MAPSAMEARLTTARQLGQDPSLVLHGGGNVSFKDVGPDLFGNHRPLMWVKASGFDLAQLEAQGLVGLFLDQLSPLAQLQELSDPAMLAELRRHALDPNGPAPSLEALVHAWVPFKFVDHSHPDAMLALSSVAGGREAMQALFGNELLVFDYVEAGFPLALAMKKVFAQGEPQAKGVFFKHHGLFTWGETAQESLQRHLALADKAKAALGQQQTELPAFAGKPQPLSRLFEVQHALGNVMLARLDARPETLALLAHKAAKGQLCTPPLTPDHLIRTGYKPLWWTPPECLANVLESYEAEMKQYLTGAGFSEPSASDLLPRQILAPGLGAIAIGANEQELQINSDILRHCLAAKGALLAQGKQFVGLDEAACGHMQVRPYQLAKKKPGNLDLGHKVALITGAAGAIGSGISHELLDHGMNLMATDLGGERLETLTQQLQSQYGQRAQSTGLDVTNLASIEAAIDACMARWGRLDLLVINQGLAHVATLADLELSDFQRLEKVNTEGTLLLLKALSRHFKAQGMAGDVVLVSTKNVYSPSASFGAYSATKAGAHQLARIAALELAELGVRVNMVSPDGVFSDQGAMKSGLWATVGPDRMKARGLNEAGLEEYYQNRNQLKTKVTARDVGRAVLYFASRQSPTTGACIPVDGGLPDAVPR